MDCSRDKIPFLNCRVPNSLDFKEELFAFFSECGAATLGTWSDGFSGLNYKNVCTKDHRSSRYN